jgi:branched-chain amino acid transport system permease protein
LFLQLCINSVVNGCIYGLVAVGLVILINSSTILNFSHGEFFMISAFLALTFFSFLNFPYLISIMLAIVILYFIGVLLNKVIFQKMLNAPHISLVMITIGLSSVLKGASRLIWGFDIHSIPPLFSDEPIRMFNMVFTFQDITIVISTIAFGIIFGIVFFFTKMGKVMRASTQSIRGAALVGINIETFLTVMWGLSAAIGAFAGILIAPLILIYTGMGERILMRAFGAMVLGGFGSIKGAIIGSVLIAFTENFVGCYISNTIGDISPFIVMIAFLLIRPTGLFREA